MNTYEVLVAARAEVEKGWVQHGLDTTRGVCAMGGLKRVEGLSYPVDQSAAYRALCSVLPEGYSSGYVGQFNDNPSTTKADVLALFDRAITAEAVKTTSDPAHVYTLA